MPLPPPQQIEASHDSGLIYQLSGGRALRGTLVVDVRSTLKSVTMKNGGGVPREILEEGALLLGKLLQERSQELARGGT